MKGLTSATNLGRCRVEPFCRYFCMISARIQPDYCPTPARIQPEYSPISARFLPEYSPVLDRPQLGLCFCVSV